jgi:hypothetical protein
MVAATVWAQVAGLIGAWIFAPPSPEHLDKNVPFLRPYARA